MAGVVMRDRQRRRSLRNRRYSGTGLQFIYDDKNCLGLIEPLASSRWRAVKSGKEIGTYGTRAEAVEAVEDERWRGRPR
jgi:hypothetical protein